MFKAFATHRPAVSPDALALSVSLFFALAFNAPFLQAVMQGRDALAPATWAFALAMVVMLTAVHFVIAALPAHRRWIKPWLALLVIVAAFASYFMQRYGVFLDPTMLRNAFHSDPAEASEVLGWGLVPHLLAFAVLPIIAIGYPKLTVRRWPRALAVRLGFLALAVLMAAGAVLLVFQDFSSLMRNQKELRYLITPANAVYSTARVLVGNTREAQAPRTPVGLDARLQPSVAPSKPKLMVIVLGETARAANWGLSGYARDTTPTLAKRSDVINFANVSACGTNTETSVPCMFSAVGRRDYDEHRIRTSESLLHVLQRAGHAVTWRDNQSGCKGTCDGLREDRVDSARAPELCQDGRCLDEALLKDLDRLLVPRGSHPDGGVVLVLHMLGNHGPTYHKRYPPSFRHFAPTCDTGDLKQCDRASIVNAYDNALRYTDHVLGQLIVWLEAQAPRFDAAMLYVSDHGESLGERGLFLHGVPYAIAPKEQIQVPMVWWMAPGFKARSGVDTACLVNQASKPWSHDHLFHSVLGLMDVATTVLEPALDISATCRSKP